MEKLHSWVPGSHFNVGLCMDYLTVASDKKMWLTKVVAIECATDKCTQIFVCIIKPRKYPHCELFPLYIDTSMSMAYGTRFSTF